MTAPAMSFGTDNGRYYRHPGHHKTVPSITNIKNVKGVEAIKYAAVRDAATYAVDNYDRLHGLNRDEAITLIKKAPFARSDDSPSAIGDVVHDWIDVWVKDGCPDLADYVPYGMLKATPQAPDGYKQAPITARRMWGQFIEFVRYYTAKAGLRFIDSEFTVWSDTYGYAGTADLAMVLNDEYVLADTKTGKAAYPDTAMQLAPLAKADYIITPDGEAKTLYPFTKFAILHLRPMSYQLIPVYNIDEAFKAFLGLKAEFDWDVQYSDRTLGYAPKFGSQEKR